MNIEELLIAYTNLAHKHDQAYEEQKNLEILMEQLLYKNEEALYLNDADGYSIGITITIQTPHNLQTMSIGSAIAVDGREWMHLPDNWVSCYGTQFTDNQMFVNIMCHRDNIRLIHKGY